VPTLARTRASAGTGACQCWLEGTDAYRKYQKDGSAEVWQKLSQQDMRAVELLVDELERMVREGRFRMRKPGAAQ
jgi:hypothetical protein